MNHSWRFQRKCPYPDIFESEWECERCGAVRTVDSEKKPDPEFLTWSREHEAWMGCDDTVAWAVTTS